MSQQQQINVTQYMEMLNSLPPSQASSTRGRRKKVGLALSKE
jgi:hypothetical protein